MSKMKSLKYRGLKTRKKGLVSKDPVISVLNKILEIVSLNNFANMEPGI